MKVLFKSLLVLTIWLTPAVLLAQDSPEMADAMRESGKIYVVVAILLVVLGGLIGYLILLDRKVTRLERQGGNQRK